MSIHLMDLIESCSAQALSTKLLVTEASEWRSLCRKYSEKFHTPLHLVIDMDPEFVILNLYESNLEDVDVSESLEDLRDRVMHLEDPNYDAAKEKELAEFIKQAEEEEAERIKSGRPIRKSKKTDEASLPGGPSEKKPPTQGYLNLSYLEDMDREE